MCLTEKKIAFLRDVLDKKIENNNYKINDEIVRLSKALDEQIVSYEIELNKTDKYEENI